MAISINGTTGISGVDGSAGTPAVQGTDSNTGLVFPAADTVAVATGGTERMRVDSSGNVGIGTSSPAQRLEIIKGASGGGSLDIAQFTAQDTTSTNATNPRIILGGKNTAGAFNIAAVQGLNTVSNGGDLVFQTTPALGSLSERMRISSNGELIIKRTAQVAAATITCSTTQNTRQMSFVNNNNNNEVGYIFCNNDGTTTQYATTSDYRLKENVQPMTGALAKVQTLKPVTYTWKINGCAGQGFIAHELQEIVPSAVSGNKDEVETYLDKDGNEQTRPIYQGIDTSFLVATLTAAIQELKAENDALKARLDAANL